MASAIRTSRARRLALVAAVACVGGSVLSAQAPAPPASTSATSAKELVGLLQARKLEAYAVRDPSESGRFVAVLLIPNVQLLVVSAAYERPMDIEYRLYHKDFMNAYMDLNSSVYSQAKFFVDDAQGDGLKAVPGKEPGRDAVKAEGQDRVFDGAFADPRRRNDKRISQEDYFKAFVAADERYARLLGVLVAELKKSPT